MLSTSGFPSPAQGYEANDIDFNSLLIKNKAACFCMRMKGYFLSDRGITEGDILIVDRSIRPSPGRLVVFCSDEGFLCREIVKTRQGVAIQMGLDIFRSMEGLPIFGVVTAVVRQL